MALLNIAWLLYCVFAAVSFGIGCAGGAGYNRAGGMDQCSASQLALPPLLPYASQLALPPLLPYASQLALPPLLPVASQLALPPLPYICIIVIVYVICPPSIARPTYRIHIYRQTRWTPTPKFLNVFKFNVWPSIHPSGPVESMRRSRNMWQNLLITCVHACKASFTQPYILAWCYGIGALTLNKCDASPLYLLDHRPSAAPNTSHV